MECVRKLGDVTAFYVERERRRKRARGELREVLHARATEAWAPSEDAKILAFPDRPLEPMTPAREATELIRHYLQLEGDDRARIFREVCRLGRG